MRRDLKRDKAVAVAVIAGLRLRGSCGPQSADAAEHEVAELSCLAVEDAPCASGSRHR